MPSTVAAPNPPRKLEPCLLPFGRSFTLPAEAYLSEQVFAWERTHLFEASWVCVGRSEDVARPGDRKAFGAGAEEILVVRDQAGALHAFFNVCRHRGHQLLQPGACVNATVIRCPYHAWVYGLDGSLKGAPRYGEVEGFDKADYPLIEARAAEWRGWLFVNASGDAPALSGHVGNLDEFVAPYEPERLRSAARHGYVVKTNWKIAHENYHECYHCPSIHPELCRVTPPDSGENMAPTGAWAGGTMDLMDHAETMSLDGRSHGVALRGLDETRRRQVLYFGLLPNLLISLHPDYVMTHRMEPLSTDRTLIECEWLFAPEALERDGFDPSYAADFWDVTNKQDWRATESVRRGVASRGYRQGRLSPVEDAVYAFITTVARAYLGRGVKAPAPAAAASS
ncbi:MAG: aromatic ring-hydroxylating oxygenase subunit alpha [Actinomycetota bacterium]